MTTLNYEDQAPWHASFFIEKSRLLKISDLALPMVAGALATNLMTFIDTLMVGQLGDSALGGVGIGGQLFFLLLAVSLGLAAGVQAMVSIVTLSLANILFNYMLIFGNFGAPRMEVAGAGLGSTFAVLVGLLINFGFALKFASKNGFLRGLPDQDHIKTMLKVSSPESLRQALFTVGVVLLYVLIGRIGTSELAAFHVVISICLIAYLPHIGIGGAAITLVGEALGRKDIPDARKWGWQVSNAGLMVLMGLGLIVALFPQVILKLFIVDELTLAIAILPLQLAVFAHVLDGYGKVLGSALIGAGAAKSAMQLTLLPQWMFLLPLIAVSVSMGYGLNEAMAILIVSTAISALLFIYVWRRERWSSIQL